MTYASENRAWLEPYIADIADRMGLHHWKVELIDDDPDADCQAQVWMQGDALWGRILLKPHDDADDLRDSVVHELIHLHLHSLDRILRRVRDHLSPAVYDVTNDFRERALEQTVASMTRAWAPLLPLPEIPVAESN